MKQYLKCVGVVAACLAFVVLTACESDSGSGGNSLVGTWRLTGETVNGEDVLMAGSFTVTLRSNGTYEMIATDRLGGTEVETGTWTSTSTHITTTENGEESDDPARYVISGNTLTITIQDDFFVEVLTFTRV